MKSKKIAGVSVNIDNPPTREGLVKMALKSTPYYRKKHNVALKEINQEINKSGLYSNISKNTKPRNIKSSDK